MSVAIPFTIWVFDCPECGGQTEIEDGEPYFTETCWDCGQPIRMGSPDWGDDQACPLDTPCEVLP